ncbi:MAG: hypothetical protein ABSG17_08555 [Spirochaetia bacterium]
MVPTLGETKLPQRIFPGQNFGSIPQDDGIDSPQWLAGPERLDGQRQVVVLGAESESFLTERHREEPFLNLPAKENFFAGEITNETAEHEPVKVHDENLGVQLSNGFVQGRGSICFDRKLRFVLKRNFPVAYPHAVGKVGEVWAAAEKRKRVLHAAPAERVSNRNAQYEISRA